MTYESERIFNEVGVKLNHPSNPHSTRMILTDYLKNNNNENLRNVNIDMTVGIDLGGNNYVLSGYDNKSNPPIPKIIEDVYSQKKTQYL